MIKEQKNDAIKNIPCDITPEFHSDKINLIFNLLIKNLNFVEILLIPEKSNIKFNKKKRRIKIS